MRLHVVDGTFELFRAHYARRPGFETPQGRDLKATVGVVESMMQLLRDPEESPTHIAVAFDNPVRSFRNRLFDGYKTGDGIEPALAAQFDDVEEAVAALGLAVWSMDEWEADDAMATATHRYPEVSQVRLMTPDKDLGQCLRGDAVVQVDRIRNRLIDESALRQRRGFGPASIPDFLALVGDSADGIPGLPGFGEKSAGTLLGRYEHVEAVPDDPEQWDVSVRGAKRLAATLAGARTEVALYKQLATLVTDVPLETSLPELEYQGAPRQRWRQWCESVGRPDLGDRPPLFAD